MYSKIVKLFFYCALAGIEYLALTPQHIQIIESFWDKQNHFLAFFVLYILLTYAYTTVSVSKKVVLLILMGFQIEVMQYFIPGRFFSLLDIVADTIGIAIGFAIHQFLMKRWLVS